MDIFIVKHNHTFTALNMSQAQKHSCKRKGLNRDLNLRNGKLG